MSAATATSSPAPANRALLKVRASVRDTMADDVLTSAEILDRLTARGVWVNKRTLNAALNMPVTEAKDSGFLRTTKVVEKPRLNIDGDLATDDDGNVLTMKQALPAYAVVTVKRKQRGGESAYRLAKGHLTMWRRRRAEIEAAIALGMAGDHDANAVKAADSVVVGLEAVQAVHKSEETAQHADAEKAAALAEAARLRKALAEAEARLADAGGGTE